MDADRCEDKSAGQLYFMRRMMIPRGSTFVFDGKVIVGTRAKKKACKELQCIFSINFPYLAVIQDGILVRYIPEIPCRHAVKFYYDMKDSVYVLKS